MKKAKRILGILLPLVVLSLAILACSGLEAGTSNTDPTIPTITTDDRGWVDVTSSVSATTLNQLRDVSVTFEQEGFQLAGAFFSDCPQGDENKVATELGSQNGIGSADKDNGLVFAVFLDKQGADGHTPYLYVATGKGLEGTLNDAKVGRFLDAYFVPARAAGNWEQGIVTVAKKFAEYLADPSNAEFSDSSLKALAPRDQTLTLPDWPWWVWLTIACVVVILLVTYIVAVVKADDDTRGCLFAPFWIIGGIASLFGGGGDFGGGGSGR